MNELTKSFENEVRANITLKSDNDELRDENSKLSLANDAFRRGHQTEFERLKSRLSVKEQVGPRSYY